MVNSEFVYDGADDILMPKYNSTGYQTKLENVGLTLDGRSANQLGELNHKLNPGAKVIEIQGTDAGIWESVPEQHIEEIARLAKVTGVKPSFHAPIMEASGVDVQQGKWDEENRESAERQLLSAVLRGNKLDRDGNVSVTVHSTAGVPELKPITKTKEGIEKKGPFWVIDKESGKIGQLPREKRYLGEEGEFTGKALGFDEKRELEKINQNVWLQELSQLNRYASYGEEAIQGLFRGSQEEEKTKEEKERYLAGIISKSDTEIENIIDEKEKEYAKKVQKQISHGQIYLRDSYRTMKSLFDQAYAKATDNDRKMLDNFAKEITPDIKGGMENNPEKILKFGEIIEDGIKILGEIKTPTLYEPLADFVVDKSAETFANVAAQAYDKFGDKAPMINIENPPAGGGLSKAEDLRALVEKAREKLAENLRKQGLSKSSAEKTAEKTIGATWDLGHINMLRKSGYSEKDIVEQTKIIAPYVRHVHLSDNFGYEHTELPMGMGNVPTKEMMEIIDKSAKGEKGFEGKKIVEAISWFQHFQEKGGGHAYTKTAEAFDAPLFAGGEGPTWGQMGAQPSYSGAMGPMGPINPQVHHSLYGAGFSTLPASLGGEMPGTQSRFSGTPNQ